MKPTVLWNCVIGWRKELDDRETKEIRFGDNLPKHAREKCAVDCLRVIAKGVKEYARRFNARKSSDLGS